MELSLQQTAMHAAKRPEKENFGATQMEMSKFEKARENSNRKSRTFARRSAHPHDRHGGHLAVEGVGPAGHGTSLAVTAGSGPENESGNESESKETLPTSNTITIM